MPFLLETAPAAQLADALNLRDLRGCRHPVDGAYGRHRWAGAWSRSRPERGHHIELGSKRVRGLLVVHPPSLEMRPRGLRITFELDSAGAGVLRARDELVVRQLDRVVGAWVVRNRMPDAR